MTLEQLEQRVDELEKQLAELRNEVNPGRVRPESTFGMFADDTEFDEIVRLGREFREQANAEDK